LIKEGEPNEVAAGVHRMAYAMADMERVLEGTFDGLSAGSADLVSELYWVAQEYKEYLQKYDKARVGCPRCA
jgi:hypothetical protein